MVRSGILFVQTGAFDMGWKTAWFGSEDPTRGQVGKVVLVLAIMAATLYGIVTDFVPSGPLGTRGVFIFLALGVAATLAVAMHAVRTGRYEALMEQGVLRLVVGVLAAPFMLALVLWLTLKTIGSLVTQAVGSDYRQPATMHTHYTRSRRSCDYRLTGGILEDTFPKYLCISEAGYHRRPEQAVDVVLVGQESWLGVHIDDAYVQER
jgi:hypothetical protein